MHAICPEPTLLILDREAYNRSGLHVLQGVATPNPWNPGARYPAPSDVLHPSRVLSNQSLASHGIGSAATGPQEATAK